MTDDSAPQIGGSTLHETDGQPARSWSPVLLNKQRKPRRFLRQIHGKFRERAECQAICRIDLDRRIGGFDKQPFRNRFDDATNLRRPFLCCVARFIVAWLLIAIHRFVGELGNPRERLLVTSFILSHGTTSWLKSGKVIP